MNKINLEKFDVSTFILFVCNEVFIIYNNEVVTKQQYECNFYKIYFLVN